MERRIIIIKININNKKKKKKEKKKKEKKKERKIEREKKINTFHAKLKIDSKMPIPLFVLVHYAQQIGAWGCLKTKKERERQNERERDRKLEHGCMKESKRV